MKKIFSLILMLLASNAFALTEQGVKDAEFGLNRGQAVKYELGTKLMKNRYYVAKCRYDFAVQGGSSAAAFNLVDEKGQACVIPKNAIIREVLIDALTTGATSSSATMKLSSKSDADLKASLAAASYSGLVAGIPTGSAASAIKMTADTTVTGRILIGTFTAGKFNVLITYEMSQ
jgi:hypothetical protein